MGIVSYQGLIYIVGGCTHSRRHMQELVSYNPVTRQSISMAMASLVRSNDKWQKSSTSLIINVAKKVVFS